MPIIQKSGRFLNCTFHWNELTLWKKNENWIMSKQCLSFFRFSNHLFHWKWVYIKEILYILEIFMFNDIITLSKTGILNLTIYSIPSCRLDPEGHRKCLTICFCSITNTFWSFQNFCWCLLVARSIWLNVRPPFAHIWNKGYNKFGSFTVKTKISKVDYLNFRLYLLNTNHNFF